MAKSIDERVVAMSFENAKFEAGVAQTLKTLQKLNESLANIGKVNGLANLEAAANKVTLTAPMSAIDKLKAKLGFGESAAAFSQIETESAKVTLTSPMSALDKLKAKLGFGEAPAAFSKIETEASKVTLQGPMGALDKLKARLGSLDVGKAFNTLENAANRVTFGGLDKAIDKIRGKITFPEADKAFSNIEKASNNVEFSGLLRAIQSAAGSFSILEGAASVALGNIATKAIAAGGQLVKSLTFDQLSSGFDEYSTNLNSIQTILANTEQSGAGLKEVNAALQELNLYSDQTIYNFSEMAKNIGTFTAAGVDLDRATASIKGIANLAALSGSNSQQASTAMYQLSQAISSGRVSLQDWNSVVNAGMGGVKFQSALTQTAVNMGIIDEKAVKIKDKMGNLAIDGQSFRESIMAKPGEQSWLTSDVLTKTLEQFTGDMSEADLAAQGFTETQIKSIMATAKTAKAAATEVKTLKGVFDVAKEGMGSGWAATWQLIFGDFNQAKRTFTDLSQFFQKFIGDSANARNAILKTWKDLGGRTDLIEGIKALFDGIVSVLKPIKDAFREIFPRQTGADLAELTKRFRELMEGFKLDPTTSENLRRTFEGLFSVLHIGVTVVKELIGLVLRLLGSAAEGSGGILEFTGSVGQFIKSIDVALTKGGLLAGWFEGLANVLTLPLKLLHAIAAAIAALFADDDGSAADAFTGKLKGLEGQLKPLAKLVVLATDAWEGFLDILGRIRDALEPWFAMAIQIFQQFVTELGTLFDRIDWDKVLGTFEVGFIGGIFLLVKKALSSGFAVNFGEGLSENIGQLLSGLTKNLSAMQKNIQANTILQIALAVGVLAVSLKVLTTIDSKRLSEAMLAIAIGLGQLIGAMRLLLAGGGWAGFLKLPVAAASMILMAGAMVIFATAMKIMATMNWQELARGLTGILFSLVALGTGLQAVGPMFILEAVAIGLVAGALILLASAVKLFAQLDWEQLARGLAGVLFGLTALAPFAAEMAALGPGMIIGATGLTIMAFAITVLASAIKTLGEMKWEDMAKGIVGLFGALLALTPFAIGLTVLGPGLILGAAGLVVMAVGLQGLAVAIKSMGGMKPAVLAKGILAIGAALLVMGVGLTAMIAALPGALALTVVAVGLAALAPTLAFLGTLNWGTIFKGLTAMALALSTIAIFGLAAAPALLLLGISLIPMSVAARIAAQAVLALANAFKIFGQTGPAAVAAAVTAISALILLLPKVVVDFLKGVVLVAQEIVKLLPMVLDAISKIILQLVNTVIELAPKLAEGIIQLVAAIAKVVVESLPLILKAGVEVLLALLQGIQSHISDIVATVAVVMAKFLEAAASHAGEITEAGAQLIVQIIKGVTRKLPDLVKAVSIMMVKFIEEMGNHVADLVKEVARFMGKVLGGIVSFYPSMVEAGAETLMKFISGLGIKGPELAKAAVTAAGKFLNSLATELVKLGNMGADAVIKFLNGLEAGIRTRGPELRAAGYGVGDALLDGIRAGILEMGMKIVDDLEWLIKLLPARARRILGIHSPSTVFAEIGRYMMQGMSMGIDKGTDDVVQTTDASIQEIVDRTKDGLGGLASIFDGLIDADPVITPVLDLTQVESEAKKLSDLTNVVPITAAASYGQAAAISREKEAADVASADQAAASSTVFNYEQNNYSPEPLPSIEIYRQTNNQLAKVQKVLNL